MQKRIHVFLITVILLIFPVIVFAIRFPDPINATAPIEVFARVIKGLLIAIAVFAFLNFVLAGIGIITSRGDSQKLEKNKENLKWTIIGMALLFAAYAIVSYVVDSLSTAIGL